MNFKATKSLFSPKKNFVFIYFPIILLLICFVELVYKINFGILGKKHFVSYILSDLVFLNVVHNVFTLIILISSSNMQQWLECRGRKTFWIKILAGTSLICVIVYYFLANVFSAKVNLAIGLMIFVALPIHHAISQSMGLSFMYSAASLDGLPRTKHIFREKLFSVLLMTASIIAISLTQYFPQLFQRYGKIFVAVSCLSVLLLLINNAFLCRAFHLEKFLFSMRYLLWPISFFSFFGVFATKAVHGTEYYFVADKMISKSKKLSRIGLSVLLLIAILFLTIIRSYYFQYHDNSQQINVVFTLLAAFSVSFTLLHYYLDRIIFQMKEPINRETSGALLKI